MLKIQTCKQTTNKNLVEVEMTMKRGAHIDFQIKTLKPDQTQADIRKIIPDTEYSQTKQKQSSSLIYQFIRWIDKKLQQKICNKIVVVSSEQMFYVSKTNVYL